MKNFIITVAALTLSLTIYGQSSNSYTLSKELQKRFEQIEQYNSFIRNNRAPVSQTPKIKLDSIISWRYDSILGSWYELEKSVLTFYSNGTVKTWKGFGVSSIVETNYNADGYLTSINAYKYEFGYWVKNWRIENSYDADFNKIQSLRYDGIANSWVLSEQENWTYDSSSNLILYENHQIQGGTLVNNVKIEYIYNSLNLEISKANYYWTNGAWYPSSKTERDYDLAGNEILKIDYFGDSTSWKPFSKSIISYTSFDMPEMKMSFSWDAIQSNWINSDSSWAVYNVDGLLQSDTVFSWNNTQWEYQTLQEIVYDDSNNVVLDEIKVWGANNWNNYRKVEKMYDMENRLVYSVSYLWNSVEGYWMNQYKYQKHYSPAGDTVYEISSYGQDSLWFGSMKFVHYYNINVNVDEITPGDFFWASSFQLLRSQVFYEKNNQWSMEDSTNYYYSDFLTSIEVVSENGIRIYPNPAHTFITVEGIHSSGAQVEVLDVQGRVIKRVFASFTGFQLNVEELESGIYFVRVSEGNNRVVVKKVIKQ